LYGAEIVPLKGENPPPGNVIVNAEPAVPFAILLGVIVGVIAFPEASVNPDTVGEPVNVY
jgi:hypothetical protein